jgi:hypothetical protein
MLGRVLAVACLLGGTSVVNAQQQASAPSYTDILLGVGHTLDEAAWSLGFEHKPAGSRVAWRVLLEQWDHHTMLPTADQPDFHARRFLGAQLLGLRLFRQSRRVQPYVLGGLGVYRETYMFGHSSYTLDPDGAPIRGAMTTGHGERTNHFMLWGTGMNVKVSGVTLFGELKLPMPMGGGVGRFTAAPFLFGIRF